MQKREKTVVAVRPTVHRRAPRLAVDPTLGYAIFGVRAPQLRIAVYCPWSDPYHGAAGYHLATDYRVSDGDARRDGNWRVEAQDFVKDAVEVGHTLQKAGGIEAGV